jgi:hypothetical protein
VVEGSSASRKVESREERRVGLGTTSVEVGLRVDKRINGRFILQNGPSAIFSRSEGVHIIDLPGRAHSAIAGAKEIEVAPTG